MNAPFHNPQLPSLKFICLACKSRFVAPPEAHICQGKVSTSTSRIIPVAEYVGPKQRHYAFEVCVRVAGPTKRLTERCRNRIARKAQKEITALLRLAAVKRDNVAFITRTGIAADRPDDA